MLWLEACFNQCSIIRQRPLNDRKMRVFWLTGDLMNRLVHRSWGEKFVNIFLDLSKYISTFSSSTCLDRHSPARRYPALATASSTPTAASAADQPTSLSCLACFLAAYTNRLVHTSGTVEERSGLGRDVGGRPRKKRGYNQCFP